ncbi:FAD-binding domain containing protein [Colletotrichum plurivorum]|uniref:FAD-binding domain containing protein n=1 Tax=Colletotrichum plurivorum TaxID=2175906 RepID=A0A8H6K5M0_9PEZI|nr:FAD-binding domain containing protein [Colletotrichum plurivorum]
MAIQDTNGSASAPRAGGIKVAVIGAGLTGLIAAHGLQKHGFEVVVFERDPSIDARPRDWTILIHWGMATLANLVPGSVLEKLPQAFCNPHLAFDEWDESIPGYNGKTGELLFRNPTPGARRVSRLRCRRVLTEGLDIRWGSKLSALVPGEESVRLAFGDGSSFDAEYVLGTDGVSSKVRELLVGAEAAKPVPSGFLIANCNVRYNDEEKVKKILKTHSVCALMLGSGVMAGCGVMSVDDPKNIAGYETFWVKVWKGHSVTLSGPEAVEYAKGNMQGLCEPFRSAMEWTPEGSPCYVDEMKYWLPSAWNTHGGRVTLAGDAAHPMLPFRGQGLQHAIIDSLNYVNSLVKLRDSGGDVATREKLMATYGADVVERGATVVAQSLSEAENALNEETVGKMLMVTQGHGRSV